MHQISMYKRTKQSICDMLLICFDPLIFYNSSQNNKRFISRRQSVCIPNHGKKWHGWHFLQIRSSIISETGNGQQFPPFLCSWLLRFLNHMQTIYKYNTFLKYNCDTNFADDIVPVAPTTKTNKAAPIINRITLLLERAIVFLMSALVVQKLFKSERDFFW